MDALRQQGAAFCEYQATNLQPECLQMSTVSLADWMSLPAYSIGAFLGTQTLAERMPAGLVCAYYQAYVRRMNISRRFYEHTRVTSVKVGDIWPS